jgi:hypothetical protein
MSKVGLNANAIIPAPGDRDDNSSQVQDSTAFGGCRILLLLVVNSAGHRY